MTQQEIDKAIMDQIGPDTGATSNPLLAQAQANCAAEAANVAAKLNANLIDNYQVGFSNWADQVLGGRISSTPVPDSIATPPAAYVAAKASNGWTYVIRGTDPVCPVPPLPQPVKPQPPTPAPAHVMNVPPGDTIPIGTILEKPDGTRWQKTASPGPFGTYLYYLQVA